MSEVPAGWKYTERVSAERQHALALIGSFSELVKQVVDDACVARAYACPGSDRGLTHCLQPIFVLDLPKTGDALFNGPFGYRAQYWLHPFTGLEANRQLLDALTPKLMASMSVDESPDSRKLNVCTSLGAASAKIWIRESSALLDVMPDLAVEPWATEATRDVELARLGLAAPMTSKFEVKGALLDTYGNEVVPSRKIRRHFDIHEYGFS